MSFPFLSPFFSPLILIFLCLSSLFSLPLAQRFFHLTVLSSLPSLGGDGNGEGGNTATTTKTTATITTVTKPPFQLQPTVITKLTNKQKIPNHHHSQHPTITTTTTATKPTEEKKKKKSNTKPPRWEGNIKISNLRFSTSYLLWFLIFYDFRRPRSRFLMNLWHRWPRLGRPRRWCRDGRR